MVERPQLPLKSFRLWNLLLRRASQPSRQHPKPQLKRLRHQQQRRLPLPRRPPPRKERPHQLKPHPPLKVRLHPLPRVRLPPPPRVRLPQPLKERPPPLRKRRLLLNLRRRKSQSSLTSPSRHPVRLTSMDSPSSPRAREPPSRSSAPN